MGKQRLEPGNLVIEFWTGDRLTVRQVKAADDNPADIGLYIAAVAIIRIVGKSLAPKLDIEAAREDGDPVPALLSVPDRIISQRRDFRFRKAFVGCLQLLEADDIALGLVEPFQQPGQ